MHKRRADFDPLKFTPGKIHNKIELPIEELKSFFKSHTLAECAKKYNCSKVTIKRKLRSAGVDTSIHNHSDLAVGKYKESVKKVPSEEEIKKLYVDQNLDSKTIAELYGLHYNTIRKRTSKFKKSKELIQKSMMERHLKKHGIRHPAQRPDVLKKTSASLNKAKYRGNYFKSLSELAYALLLDSQGKEWYYEEMRIPYVDMMDGAKRIYIVDFTICGDDIEWIEVKPNNKMIPSDKRIYASRRAEEAGVIYRGLHDQEREDSWDLMRNGFNFAEIEFIQQKPRSSQDKITYYFKDKDKASNFELDGWKQFVKVNNDGALWKKTLVRK